MKRITALLLTVIIMLSGAGVINAFAADKGDVIIIDNSDYGDFVAPVFDADGIIAGTEQDEFDGCLFFMKGVMANPLPSSYDSRNRDGVNVVTPVKSQSPYGTCWAHAAMSNLETYDLVNGYENYKDADYSESQLVWYAKKQHQRNRRS